MWRQIQNLAVNDFTATSFGSCCSLNNAVSFLSIQSRDAARVQLLIEMLIQKLSSKQSCVCGSREMFEYRKIAVEKVAAGKSRDDFCPIIIV